MPETVREKVSELIGTLRHHLYFVLPAILASVPVSIAWADPWGGSLGVSTAYMFHGLSLSGNSVSVQADAHYRTESGWFGGLSGASVRFNPYKDETAEINAYLGKDWMFDDEWGGRLTATRYEHPNVTPSRHYDYDELAGTLSFRDSVYLTVAVIPDLTFDSTRGSADNKPAFSGDLAFHRSLWRGISTNAGIGYVDLHRLFGAGYFYGSADLGYDFGSLHVDLAYIVTDSTAKSLFEERASDRWAASLLWHF